MQGLHSLHPLLNQRRYFKIEWSSWFAPLEQLSHHLSQLKIRGFQATVFRAKQGQLKRFIDRMGLTGPFDLNQADTATISRRFSAWLGQVWQWTFQDSEMQNQEQPSEQASLFSAFEQVNVLQSFPWRAYELKSPPTVDRHLDYPLNDWSVLKPLLQEDLSTLCLHPAWTRPPAHVTEMIWTLKLYNLRELIIPLNFRHPYALHEDEKNGFLTASSQAYFSYFDAMNALKQRDDALDLPEQIPLVGWQLTVTGIQYVDAQPLDLILNRQKDPSLERIQALQNKLALPITSYVISADFDPECTFQKKPLGPKLEETHALDPWLVSSIKRPFFYYPEAKAITKPTHSSPVFLERTATSWWKDEDTQATTKDYFMVQNDKTQLIWVYRDHKEAWYEHGLYS